MAPALSRDVGTLGLNRPPVRGIPEGQGVPGVGGTLGQGSDGTPCSCQAVWPSGTECIAKYNFHGTAEQDLPFSKGDVLTIVAVTKVSCPFSLSLHPLTRASGSPWSCQSRCWV